MPKLISEDESLCIVFLDGFNGFYGFKIMKQDLEHSFLFLWPLLSLPHTKLTILFFFF